MCVRVCVVEKRAAQQKPGELDLARKHDRLLVWSRTTFTNGISITLVFVAHRSSRAWATDRRHNVMKDDGVSMRNMVSFSISHPPN